MPIFLSGFLALALSIWLFFGSGLPKASENHKVRKKVRTSIILVICLFLAALFFSGPFNAQEINPEAFAGSVILMITLASLGPFGIIVGSVFVYSTYLVVRLGFSSSYVQHNFMNSLSAGVIFAVIFAASFLVLAYFLDPRVDFFGTFIASWILIVGMMILILVAAAHAIVPLFVLAFYGFSAYLMIEDGIVPEWEAALIILDILPGMPKIIGIIISIISVGWAILSFAMDREWIDL